MSKYETLKPYKGKTCITHPEILRTDELGKSDILERERGRESLLHLCGLILQFLEKEGGLQKERKVRKRGGRSFSL